ncbi:MAG: DeoR family transcriptional regulator [Verrucomicrobiales bacterium]|nr:DeoR family transcriptional regulator [Verrucomicrobiales bacterium]
MKRFVEEEHGQEVRISTDGITLEGTLVVPEHASGLVIFAHGSGSSRHSIRNRFVAGFLNQHSLGTLLFDLLSEQEERLDLRTAKLRFDIEFLAGRLRSVMEWVSENTDVSHLNTGLFGSSTGAAAALVAAAEQQDVKAVVSRGGRPDLAGDALKSVKAPTLLIVGGDDTLVIQLNEDAQRQLRCVNELQIIPHATHLFEEPGTLETVAQLAADWFGQHLSPEQQH